MPRNRRENPWEFWVAVTAVTVSVLTFICEHASKIHLLAVHTTVWFGALVEGISWQTNVAFACTTQIGGALAIMMCMLWQKSPDFERRDAVMRFFGSTFVYYIVMFLFTTPVGPASIGQNPITEVVNLFLAFAAWDLGRVIDPSAPAKRSWFEYAPVAVMAGLVIALLFFTQGESRRQLVAWGVSPFIFACGLRLLWASRASRIAVFGMSIYVVGLALRTWFVLDGTMLNQWPGMLYYLSMGGKFACWAAVGSAPVLASRDPKRRPRASSGRMLYEETCRID